MRVVLDLTHAGKLVLRRPLEHGVLVAGRSPECELAVPDDSVAPIQFVVRRDGAAVTLTNRSPAGTVVGDERVQTDLRLADGDRIQIGPMLATVRFLSEEVGTRTRTLPHQPASDGSRLFVTAPETQPGRRWLLASGDVTVGSDASNNVVVTDPFVSSFHARFSLEAGRCMVRDLDSRNGVFVRGQKIREGEVSPGSQVRIGKTVLLVGTADAAMPDAEPVVEWRLIGSSAQLERVRDVVHRLAETDAPVLLTGETGTGKEVVARLLVELSPRAGRPFVPLNCGALNPQLIASELFGHEKGAFTGAQERKVGAFEAAHRGTLFLDEVGELPLDLQPQLLRTLESGEVRRVGSTETFRSDARLIAATNRRLDAEVRAGRFREDLYHRLHVLTVELPALRERPGDIAELAHHFLATFTPAGQQVTLEDDALARLRDHMWPGNVRELRNVMQRAVLMRNSDQIGAADIVFSPSTQASPGDSPSAVGGRTLDQIERDAIIRELRQHGGNKKEAAAALGVSRATVYRKIDELNIDVDAILRGES